jgi:hypothetical protein
MGRPRSPKSAPKHSEPEDISQEVPEVSVIEPFASSKVMTKSGAVKAAMEDGLESNEDIAGFAKSRFGLEIAATHISAEKSRLKKKGGVTVTVRARRGRPPGSGTSAKQGRKPRAAAEGYVAPPPKKATDESDLLETLEALKPLIASHGADRLKRLVDLLG